MSLTIFGGGTGYTKAETDAAILNALATYAPGAVQDKAERVTAWSTTNTSLGSLVAGSVVDGFEVDVVGTGREVEVILFTPYRHTVANAYVGPYLIQSLNGGTDVALNRVALTSSPVVGAPNGVRSLVASWDVPTVQGSTYRFRIGVYGAAGTTTLDTLGAYPMTLKARNH